MILLTHETPILLCVTPADFRKGIDGFVGLCRNELLQKPDEGTVFLFINRSRTMIRALCYDKGGYWLMTKRISQGRFQGWPSGERALSRASARELRLILDGEQSVRASGVNKTSPMTPVATTLVHNGIHHDAPRYHNQVAR